MSKRFDEIDANFKTVAFSKDGLCFYEADSAPFSVHGVYRDGEKYRRMPEEVAQSVSEKIYLLHARTAGGRVRFRTNSRRVAIVAKTGHMYQNARFALTGSAGLDLYADNRYVDTFIPPETIEDGYESCLTVPEEGWHEYTIHFPLYDELHTLYIGLDETAAVAPAAPYRVATPVVYYGSSITQGGCASRPGMAYEAIVSRALGCDFINLGFAGSAYAEPAMAAYIKTLPMSAFVYDYDHNSPDTAHLQSTHEAMFCAVREANPTLPIVILSRPKRDLSGDERKRLEIIKATYQHALDAGDQNVYFIDGPTLMALCGNEGTVDNCHPNDLGFFSMATALEQVLKEIL